MVSKQPPMFSIEKMDSEERHRQEDMAEFQKEQARLSARQHQMDTEHNADRDEVLALEQEVDFRVNEAIRHAQTTIEESMREIEEVGDILGDRAVLLEQIRV